MRIIEFKDNVVDNVECKAVRGARDLARKLNKFIFVIRCTNVAGSPFSCLWSSFKLFFIHGLL